MSTAFSSAQERARVSHTPTTESGAIGGSHAPVALQGDAEALAYNGNVSTSQDSGTA